jgi:hypothetical protein
MYGIFIYVLHVDVFGCTYITCLILNIFIGFDYAKENVRLVKVSNPYEVYQMPAMLLGQYLEDRRKTVSGSH